MDYSILTFRYEIGVVPMAELLPASKCNIFANHRYTIFYKHYEQLPEIVSHDPAFTELDAYFLFTRLFCTNGELDQRKTYAIRALYVSHFDLDGYARNVNFCDLPRYKAAFLQYVNVLTLSLVIR